tara:strand:+ start:14961 stop:15824 length:864 start_codon:yes stop_codon:yes gene_type:complete
MRIRPGFFTKIVFLATIVITFGVIHLFAQTYNVSTYNILYNTPPEHVNSWEVRKDKVASIIRFHDIVLWGSQEGEFNQLQFLRENLGQEYIGIGRDDGETAGEYSAIFFDPDLFRVVEHGTFWLSNTPDRPSMDWGVNYHRICTWGKFEVIETGDEFYMYNAHFDHESQEARENSSRMVLEHIDENTNQGDRVIFLGDLNAVPGNTAYNMIAEDHRFWDAFDVTQTPPHGPAGTFNGFSFTNIPDRRIDHIFLTEHFTVIRYGILTDSYGELRYPSDHFPVLAEIEF